VSTLEILLGVYLALTPPALGALFWSRLNRIETRMDALESNLRAEFREEFGALRLEMRQELAALRSDLTQVALAVGARPRATEA
jgi:hypothetical protein